MRNMWQLQEAKNRLSALVDGALKDGPQIITRRGRAAVVVISIKEYQKMTDSDRNLLDFFKSSPLHGLDIDLERSRDLPREVEF